MLNSTVAHANSTQNSTQSKRDAVLARALAEVEASRAHIANLEERLAIYQKQLEAEKLQASLFLEKSEIQERKIALLEQQVVLIKDALTLAEKNAALLREDLQRVRGERDSARGRLFVVGGVALVVGVGLGIFFSTGRD